MRKNFLIKTRSVFALILLLCVIFSVESFGQTCPTCTPSTNVSLTTGGTLENPISYTFGNNNNNSGASNQIFGFSGNGFYRWSTNNTITIRGLVVESGVFMTLGTSRSNGNTEAFSIEGLSATNRGCIIVKNGATLNLAWISELKYVDVCVEEGGKIIFDSENDNSGIKNSYTFDGVTINLQGPGASLEFGDSEIKIESGLDIVGWTGDITCPSAGSPNPTPTGQSGNISWNSDTVNICAILNFGVLPVEYLSFTAKHNSQDRSNEINWITASEKSNSHFIIERSVNDIKSWEVLSEVNGAINSDMPIEYNFKDSSLPLAGGNIYYRLKQVDLEVKSSLSEVISLKVGPMDGKGTWRVYPNPSNGEEIRLELLNRENYNGEEISIRLLSNYSSLENKQLIIKDIFEINNQLRQMLDPIGRGVAILEIIWGNQVEHLKILKK
ncbi:hypothetical protein Belba_0579 [Belliella baltica DSM 15883]|uniref:Secretion system C-terminal sorting domain-containing protein n=1 Tax=Belliella baltica (strain DSM 15883 / CIP 108006 / LMG 21964 / BA134) TaxID=866536 RepID=I3Z1W8_BELBD|nr:hypothetical protein [Belliella baltica]AFL83236.1 hypothetical protein Belba_0579 [Belliella baltica DSM 15883]